MNFLITFSCLIFNFVRLEEKMGPTKILFITTQLPYPPISGGTVKSWNYVKFLSQQYTLSVASLLKNEDEQHVETFSKAVKLERLITKPLMIGRSIINLLKSYLFAPSLNVFRNYSSSFQKEIKNISHQYDILIIDHYEMFQYVPADYSGKVVMHTHNAEFMLWQRMSELDSNPVKKLILAMEAYRVKRYEQRIFSRAHLIFSTPSDIDLYQRNGFVSSKHRITYHLGNESLLDLAPISFSTTEKAITFIGTLSWEPNIDGICWFLDHCWPSIKTKHPDTILYILGKSPDARIVNSAQNDTQVIFTGFIKDLDKYLQKTRVYIAPLRFGSGMKVKVLEGLYRGTPTVSTSVGAEGLDVNTGEEIMIADQVKGFTNACIDLIENENLWNKLRDKSRKVAKEKYCWEPLFQSMDTEMARLISQ